MKNKTAFFKALDKLISSRFMFSYPTKGKTQVVMKPHTYCTEQPPVSVSNNDNQFFCS